jgi:NAD(P)-dependent dehydrogenase (short-subunit alcohol dehydrogenase family)
MALMARYDLNGRVILITGAASGIGLETARLLSARGPSLALIDRDADALERAAAEIGESAEPFVADVTDRDSIESAIAAARKRFGGVDVAIAGAGISGSPTPSTDLPLDEFERVIDTNLLGVWRTLQPLLGDVIERKGYLLPIASLAAAVPAPLIAAYGASKAGVHSIGRTLRFELAHTGAKVGVGYFSVIDTPMTEAAYAEPVIERSLKSLPRALSRPAPVGAAAAAIFRGIERRSRRVCHPRWVSPVVSLHGLGAPLEALAARDPRFVRNLRKAQKEAGLGLHASTSTPNEPSAAAPGREAEEAAVDET